MKEFYHSIRQEPNLAISDTKSGIDATFSWWLSPWKKCKIYLILFGEIDETILKFDSMRGSTGDTQPKVEVPDSTFLWWLFHCKKSNISIDF